MRLGSIEKGDLVGQIRGGARHAGLGKSDGRADDAGQRNNPVLLHLHRRGFSGMAHKQAAGLALTLGR